MVLKKKARTKAGHQRRRRREEEQLELDFAARDETVAPATPDLSMIARIPPVSETQTKRLRAGVLVQQMLT